uniref:hypothetical protein n=1 Tax=Bradyrhizobium sp. SZCCHNR2026 TaxID=3057381 RepID=UPI0029168946
MRVLVGIILGLLLGFGVAFFAYPLWEGRVTIQKSDRAQVPTSEAFYVCSTKFVKDRPLVIKSANGVAKTIKMEWTAQDNYTIEKTDDFTYTAYARREENGFDLTCHRSFIQPQLESCWVVRRLAGVEQ